MGTCPVCEGEGSIPAVPDPMECPNCEGSGEDETVIETPPKPSEGDESDPRTRPRSSGTDWAAENLGLSQLRTLLPDSVDVDWDRLADLFSSADIVTVPEVTHNAAEVDQVSMVGGSTMSYPTRGPTIEFDIEAQFMFPKATYKGDDGEQPAPTPNQLQGCFGPTCYVEQYMNATPERVSYNYAVELVLEMDEVDDPAALPDLGGQQGVGILPSNGDPPPSSADPQWLAPDNTHVDVLTQNGDRVTTTTKQLEDAEIHDDGTVTL